MTDVGDPAGSESRVGPQRLAQFATRRPRRVLAVWGVAVLVSDGTFPRGALIRVAGTIDNRFQQRTVRTTAAVSPARSRVEG